MCVWSRPDIPRQNLVKLFVDASEEVKNQLVEADPRRAELIKSMVARATDTIQTKARAGSSDFAQASRDVKALHAAGKLNEAQLLAFAEQASFDKVVAAVALMCDLPVGAVERAFVQNQTEQIIVLARALDLSWATAMKLLLLHAGVNGSSRPHLDVSFANFLRLQPKSARMALQFYRMREKAESNQQREAAATAAATAPFGSLAVARVAPAYAGRSPRPSAAAQNAGQRLVEHAADIDIRNRAALAQHHKPPIQ